MLITIISDNYSYAKDGITKAGAKARPLEQGEQLYLAGHIFVFNFIGQIISARCITSKVNVDPHKIKIVFPDYSDFKTWQCYCTCKAGAGQRCKHIIGTLLYVYINAKEILPVSCTDTEQYWGKRKINALKEVAPVDEFCHGHLLKYNVKSKSNNFQPFTDDFLTQCFSAVPDSEAATFFSGRHPPRSCNITVRDEKLLEIISNHSKKSKFSKMLYDIDLNYSLSQCCIETYNKLYPCDNQFRITGTRCYNLFTYKGDDWTTKATKYFYPKLFRGNYATNYGKREEANARNLYRAHLTEHDKIIEYGLAVCYSNPSLACSPDGVLVLNGIPVALVEIKCPLIGITNSPTFITFT